MIKIAIHIVLISKYNERDYIFIIILYKNDFINNTKHTHTHTHIQINNIIYI